MQEYLIQRSSRRCHCLDRPLVPGERYFSAIVQRGSDLIRRDFSKEAWTGETADMIGWWVATIPPKKNAGLQLAPIPVLLDTLAALLDRPEKGPLAYILALLLMRKRILVENSSWDGMRVTENSLQHSNSTLEAEETRAGSSSGIELRAPTDGRDFWIQQFEISAEESTILQDELTVLLYSEE